MTIVFSCTRCQRQMSTAEEHAGRKVRCPDCSTLVTVPEPAGESKPPSAPRPRRSPSASQPTPKPKAAPASEGASFDFGTSPAAGGGGFDWSSADEGATSLRRLPKGWRRVRLGIDLVYWGALVSLGCGLVAVAALLLSLFGLGGLAVIAHFAAAPLLIVSVLLIIAGQFVCVAGPPEFGFRWVALAAAICTLLVVLAPVGFVLWLVFLWGLARTLRNRGLATQLIIFLVSIIVFPLALVCLAFASVALLQIPIGEDVGQLISVTALVIELSFVLWYLTLLASARSTVDRARMGLGH